VELVDQVQGGVRQTNSAAGVANSLLHL
jgi:hypothetical protein